MPSRSFAAGKDIQFGTEARAAMLRGVDMLAATGLYYHFCM